MAPDPVGTERPPVPVVGHAPCSGRGSAPEPRGPVSVLRRPLEPRHVLLVRGPDLIAPLLVNDLEEAGYEVTQVETSTAAVGVLEKRVPIVVLVDMNGATLRPREVLAVAAALRPAPQVIALAPFGHERGFQDALASGVFCCLPLPVTREGLLDAVRTAEAIALKEGAPALSSPSGA